MNKALLDTDILSEILRAKNPIVVQRVSEYKATFGALTISAITVMEIIKGLHKAGREDAVHKFLEGLTQTEILAFDQASAQVSRAYLRRFGTNRATDWPGRPNDCCDCHSEQFDACYGQHRALSTNSSRKLSAYAR